MYLVDLQNKNTDSLKLCLHGRLENASEIKEEINQMLGNADNAKSIIIDLSGVISMCEECFNVLNELAASYKIKFIGYSMFLEDQLKKYNLIN